MSSFAVRARGVWQFVRTPLQCGFIGGAGDLTCQTLVLDKPLVRPSRLLYSILYRYLLVMSTGETL